MADLPMAEIRAISLDAVHSVAGSQAGDAEVDIRLDSSDEPAYFITLQLDRTQQPLLTPAARIRIGQRIRDALIEAGDERYPFVRFLSRDDWNARAGARPA
ncbi:MULTISPECIES: hypothetical protein [unclassified Methylobacterium]|uniref:hypothetical protein n=1 Tax=unclassified Methylobacterium TaxID=2615210 RepID=UPI001FBB541A|nr:MULTISPECIES: hypothetical protein [unclassified Methylobacterium]MCJ2093418.1 hypothetical protein [Methylobacterium sp. J-072]MCJ2140646.1 hypothetical protein [Methylobacterium sp. E-066]